MRGYPRIPSTASEFPQGIHQKRSRILLFLREYLTRSRFGSSAPQLLILGSNDGLME